MSLCYFIDPDLNVILAIGEGIVTAVDIYQTQMVILKDSRYRPGMVGILDFSGATFEFRPQDMRRATEIIDSERTMQADLAATAVITHDSGMDFLFRALNIMLEQAKLKAKTYGSLDDAIIGLGLTHNRDEIKAFWKASKEGNVSRLHPSSR